MEKHLVLVSTGFLRVNLLLIYLQNIIVIFIILLVLMKKKCVATLRKGPYVGKIKIEFCIACSVKDILPSTLIEKLVA